MNSEEGKKLILTISSGETWIMTVSKGVLAIILISVLSFSSAIDIIIYPFQETGAIPMKVTHTPQARYNFPPDTWSVVFVCIVFFNALAEAHNHGDSFIRLIIIESFQI
jgi:hypothetical protein